MTDRIIPPSISEHTDPIPTQEYFDVDDLARRFKTSTRHIFRMADQGRMPWGMKLGQLRRWSRRAIEEWERGGCQPVRTTAKGSR